ncbi:hypothetical protein DPX39_110112800 [Trypanosoma brucei equiperdum]|uniref:Uncharacterized protein n=1 Tax=Trypanosoma brucei equiperdum TaxID=630700 RepID=A0A3L6KV27_9TRYP|nr:hypothetical protein DPX39_110112800 [Trypanosoma brucei equiperdum]
MTEYGPRFLLLLGSCPGEGMWSHANSYRQLVAQVQEAYGSNYDPIFKYKLPSNPKALSPPNGTCDIIIDDDDDFNIWLYGYVPIPHHRDVVDDIHHLPQPLTEKMYVFKKLSPPASLVHFSSSILLPPVHSSKPEDETGVSSLANSSTAAPSPPVLHADDDVVKLPLYPLLPPLLLVKLGVRVVLRHSDAEEAILLSSRTVSGAGEGHWALLLRKAQRAWGVQRPCLRYLDLDQGFTAINIFNIRDYMCWSTGVGRERTELIVLEHLFRDEALMKQRAHKLELMKESELSRRCIEERAEEAFGSRKFSCPSHPYTATTVATVRGVDCKLFGPSFTTDGNIPPIYEKGEGADECSLQHHKQLVDKLRRSGLF